MAEKPQTVLTYLGARAITAKHFCPVSAMTSGRGSLEQRRRIRLHSDFHHLNSSQTLCFNLLFPMLMEDSGNRLTRHQALSRHRERADALKLNTSDYVE
jgi:hypothetical protein